jgi:hypothetical protein
MHHQEPPSLAMGDMVWLDTTNITTNRPKKKLNKWLGPYPIVKVVSCNAYKLKLLLSFGRVHPVFNVSLLHPHAADEIPERPAPCPPPPIIRDGQEEYEVERILDSQLCYQCLECLMHWKGYSHADDTWVSAKDVKAARLIWEFHAANPQAPQWISAAMFAQLPFRPYENLTEPPTERLLFNWESGTYALLRHHALRGG